MATMDGMDNTMKIKIRKGLFETNSSSIHALCIPTNEEYVLPKKVVFRTGEYGWGPDKEYNTGNYLYTTLLDLKLDDRIQQLKEILEEHGIETIFKEPSPDDYYYVDHAGCFDEDFLGDIFSDEDKLLRYLFCPSSHIILFNDNSDCTEARKELSEIENSKDWEIYEKWN